jgi:hypothetical protein
LLLIKPLGGQTGDGEGVIFAFFVAAIVDVWAECAAGAKRINARTSEITFLIAIPLELTDAEEDSDN